MKAFIPEETPAGGFQIAPMIDVVFVIMLFFMVMAGAVKVENELNTTLPGSTESSSATDFVDEIIISISESGEVALNDEPLDVPDSRDLPRLRDTLMRLKQNADNAKTPAVVTIVSDPNAKYSRTVDVLDVLAFAKIETVTFSVSDE
ncbi:MAG: biopolymer transport protein ExbD [Verrucomicrobia bacterium]|nr:MAG: biopolymer transport protein ExbD [Verrucomicrobiota bacterium]